MANPTATFEVINSSINTMFTNATDFDLGICTGTSNQSIHLGTRGVSSAVKVTSSNVELNGDLLINNGRAVNFTGIKINRKTTNAPQNLIVASASNANLTSNGSNITFTLSNGQSNYRFVNSNNMQVALLDGSTGNLTIAGQTDVTNIGCYKNRVINGAMRIAQRGSSLLMTSGTSNALLVDRFAVAYSNMIAGAITQSNIPLTSNDLPLQQIGLNSAWRLRASTACTNYAWITPLQNIEGFNVDDFNWGTSVGSSAAISFYFRASNVTPGAVIPVAIRNATSNWSYVTPVTVNSNNTWQYVSAIIPPPPNTSTWEATSNIGIQVVMAGHAPSSQTASSSNTWLNANCITLSNATNTWATSNYTLDITGVQFEKGTLATSFEFRPISLELTLCQRYYEIVNKYPDRYAQTAYPAGGGAYNLWFTFKTTKRTSIPVLENASTIVTVGEANGSVSSVAITDTDITWFFIVGASGRISYLVNANVCVSAEF